MVRKFSTLREYALWNSNFICLLPLLGFLVFLCEMVFDRPNPIWAFVLFLWSSSATLLAFLMRRESSVKLWDTFDRHANHLVFGAIIVFSLVFVLVNTLQLYYFMPGTDAEDTAYYSQLLWNTLNGDFLSGNLQQERIYNPPVSTDLALHVSPILLVFVPAYAMLSSPLTLLVIRDFILFGAAWPLFLLAREKIGSTAGVAAALLYVTNPTIIAQGLDGFYLLQFAPFPFFYAFRAFIQDRRGGFVGWMGVALSLREDVAIAFSGFGLLALIRRYSLSWLFCSLVIPILWWGGATQFIQPAFGRQGNGELDIALAGGQNSLGAYLILLGVPSWLFDALSGDGFQYLYRLFRSVAFLGILGPESVLGIPGISANLFLGRVFDSGIDETSRFSVLPVCSLLVVTILVVVRLSKQVILDQRLYIVVVLLLFPSVSIIDGLKDTFENRIRKSYIHNDVPILWEAVHQIPRIASVAAPKSALPALANRRRLYFLQNFHEYPKGTQVEYFLLDLNLDRFDRNLERRIHYAALMKELSSSSNYRLVWQKGEYALYQQRSSTEGERLR